ncbi:MAG: ATP-binding protein [Ginsengibacter sp.]
MRVKRKIWLGSFFMFILLVVTATVGIIFMANLKKDAKKILQDNYESLSYTIEMEQSLDTIPLVNNITIQRFNNALTRQEHNITETGEAQITANLRSAFTNFTRGDTSIGNLKKLHESIQNILVINMKAIQRKGQNAEKTAGDALTIIIALGGIVFIIGLTFVINFPGIITNPISNLTQGIKEIANKNYKHRIHIDNKDEFGTLADAFNEMAERLEYFESSNLNKLLLEKARAEAVINSLRDASIGIDKNDHVLFANKQALELLGLSSEDVANVDVITLKKRNDLFAFLIDNNNSTPFKIVVDNKENYFVKEVMDITEGDTRNKVIVLKNITSFKELDVAKTNFIATISHELKTPLASSDFSIKLLEDERTGKLSHEQKELVQNLRGDNQRILKILSELLNMAQVETGNIQLNILKVSAGKIVHNAVDAVIQSAKEKNIHLKISVPNDLPDIEADEDKTTWVLINFLTNAIKYSPSNRDIEINVIPQTGTVIFAVADHGPGIDKEYLPRLFERYFQVPGTGQKGTGLGLAISKQFIEAQAGKIWADSEIGNGAVFKFSLRSL